jgi:uncharacterized protein (DUF2235 family)
MMKRIIVCCDGTWNADDSQTNDTNVAWHELSTGLRRLAAFFKSCSTCGASARQG